MNAKISMFPSVQNPNHIKLSMVKEIRNAIKEFQKEPTKEHFEKIDSLTKRLTH